MNFFKKIIRELFRSKITKNFTNSARYWEDRYYYGGNSGKGSYFQEAIEKADYLNAKIKQFNIGSLVTAHRQNVMISCQNLSVQ